MGIIFGEQATHLKPIGTLFVNSIKMLIVPLVFCSLIVGVTSMQDTNKMGRIGFKSFAFYLFTTAIAITIGLIVGYVLQPGAGLGLSLADGTAQTAKEIPSLVDTLIDIVPTNPIAALASGQILQYCSQNMVQCYNMVILYGTSLTLFIIIHLQYCRLAEDFFLLGNP